MANDVEVRIDGLPLVSSDDWARAQHTPESELPTIDPAQYPTSRLLGLPTVADAPALSGLGQLKT